MQKYIPAFLSSTADSYTRVEYAKEISKNLVETSFYAVLYSKVLFYAVSFMLAYIYIKYEKIITLNTRYTFLIKFILLFTIAVNLTGFIPSFSRMQLITNLLTLFVFINFVALVPINNKEAFSLKVVLVPALIFYNIVQMRVGFDYLSTEAIFANPIVAFFNLEKTPLIDFIK
mgnify:CR=1 FL=1